MPPESPGGTFFCPTDRPPDPGIEPVPDGGIRPRPYRSPVFRRAGGGRCRAIRSVPGAADAVPATLTRAAWPTRPTSLPSSLVRRLSGAFSPESLCAYNLRRCPVFPAILPGCFPVTATAVSIHLQRETKSCRTGVPTDCIFVQSLHVSLTSMPFWRATCGRITGRLCGAAAVRGGQALCAVPGAHRRRTGRGVAGKSGVHPLADPAD